MQATGNPPAEGREAKKNPPSFDKLRRRVLLFKSS